MFVCPVKYKAAHEAIMVTLYSLSLQKENSYGPKKSYTRTIFITARIISNF